MKQRKPSAKAKRDTINLYWVTTDDHDEDWFILAATAQAARRYHTDYEGYDTGDAHAELILGQVARPDPRSYATACTVGRPPQAGF